MKYMLYIKDNDTENNMTIECNDANDLAKYASESIKQGYTDVRAVIENTH
ncbi:hypothetical protein [Anaerophilus nitritogenes]|nr:hypothetical protein [Anaerophilus nitritogenes]